MHEIQHIQIDESPPCYGSFRAEIAGPECFRMTFEKLVPGAGTSFRTLLDPRFLDDIFNSLTADARDAKFSKFTQDASVPEAQVLGFG